MPAASPIEVIITEGPHGPLYLITAATAEAVNGEIYNLSETSKFPLSFSLPIRLHNGTFISYGRKLL